MGLLEQVEQKAFLGMEFLTWLWHKSEVGEGKIDIEGEDLIEIHFEGTMMLEAQHGEATVQTLKGETPGASSEARAALLEGKKIKRCKIALAQGELEWSFSFRGDTFDLSGARIPAPKGLPIEEGLELRLAAAERLFALIDKLFEIFLALRLDPDEWDIELKSIHRWVEEK